MEGEEEIVGSDFVGSDDEEKSLEDLELKLKKILEEKEQLERKKKREELLLKIKQAKADVSTLHSSLQPTKQEIDKWTEDELKYFFKTKGVTVKNTSFQHLQALAKSVSEAKIPDFEVKVTPNVERRTVKINGNNHTFPHISDSKISKWSENLSSLPSIDHVVAHAYLLSSAGFDLERFKNLRQEEAYSLFTGSSVRNVKMHQLDRRYSYIKARCCSSNNDVNNSEDVWSLVNDDGNIHSAGCSCNEDTGGCKHVVALLLTLPTLNKSNAPVYHNQETKMKERSTTSVYRPESSSIDVNNTKTQDASKLDIEMNQEKVQGRRMTYEYDCSDDSKDEAEIWIPPAVRSEPKDKDVLLDVKNSDTKTKDGKTDAIFIPSTSIKSLSPVKRTESNKPQSSHSFCEDKSKPENMNQVCNKDKIDSKQSNMTQNRTKCQSFKEQDTEHNTKISQNLTELKMSSTCQTSSNPEVPAQRTTRNHISVNTPVQATIRSYRSDTIPLLPSSSIHSEDTSKKISQISLFSNECSSKSQGFVQLGKADERNNLSTHSKYELVNNNMKVNKTSLQEDQSANSMSAKDQDENKMSDKNQFRNSKGQVSAEPLRFASHDPSFNYSHQMKNHSLPEQNSAIHTTIPSYSENASTKQQNNHSGNSYPPLSYPSMSATNFSQQATQLFSATNNSVNPSTRIPYASPYQSSTTPLEYPSTRTTDINYKTTQSSVYSENDQWVNPSVSHGMVNQVRSQSQAAVLVYPEDGTNVASQKAVVSSSEVQKAKKNLSEHGLPQPLLKRYGMASEANNRPQTSRLECGPVLNRNFIQKTEQPSAAADGSKNSPVVKLPQSHGLVYQDQSQRPVTRLVYPGITSSLNSQNTEPSIFEMRASSRDSFTHDSSGMARPVNSMSKASIVECSPVAKIQFSQNTVQPTSRGPLTSHIYSEVTPVGNTFTNSTNALLNSSEEVASSLLVYPSTSEISQRVARPLSTSGVHTQNSNTTIASSLTSIGSRAYAGFSNSHAANDQLHLLGAEKTELKKEEQPSRQDLSKPFLLESTERDNARAKVNRRNRFSSPVPSSHPMTTTDTPPQQHDNSTKIPVQDIPRKTYDREFLLELRKSLFARVKPDISHLPEIMVENENVDIRPTNHPFLFKVEAGYIKGTPKKNMKPKKPRPDRSNSPKPVGHSIAREHKYQPVHRSNSPNHPSDHLSRYDVMTDASQGTDLVSEKAKSTLSTEDIIRKAIGAFNMLKNGCDASAVVEMISSLTIKDEDCLTRIVSLVVETVMEEPGLTSVCASICRVLARAKVPSLEGVLTFSTAYRQKCENEIELGILSHSAESHQRRIEELTRFTSKLSGVVLLKTTDIHEILMKLYLTGTETCLICFCSLLLEVWDRMEKCTSQNFIDQYIDIIEEIRNTEPSEALSFKILQLYRKRGKY